MKKCVVILSLIAVLVLPGCGSTVTTDGMSIEKKDFGEIESVKKTDIVTCTTTTKDSNVTMNQEVKLFFTSSGSLTSANISIDAVLDDSYLAYIDTFVSSLKTQFENFEYSDNVVVDKTSTGAIVTYSMDEDDFADQYGSASTRSAIISEMENSGYSCN